MTETIGMPGISADTIEELTDIGKKVQTEGKISETVGEIDIDPKGYLEILNKLGENLMRETNKENRRQILITANEMIDEYIAYYFQRRQELPFNVNGLREKFRAEG